MIGATTTVTIRRRQEGARDAEGHPTVTWIEGGPYQANLWERGLKRDVDPDLLATYGEWKALLPPHAAVKVNDELVEDGGPTYTVTTVRRVRLPFGGFRHTAVGLTQHTAEGR